MPILPQLQQMFQGSMATDPDKALDPAAVPQARVAIHQMIESGFNALSASAEPQPREEDLRVPVDGGSITIRRYGPLRSDSPLPCCIYMHGGGFWLATLEQSDAACRALARDTECIVVSVGYRLAPESKFPAAAEDCYAALLWLIENCAALQIDATRIALGGGSAGDNLAAVTALMARDRRGPRLVLQVLEVPVTDFTRLDPLHVPDEDLVIRSGKASYRSYYLAEPHEAQNPYASPLLAPDLSGLPPAVIMSAEYDPLRHEGEAYAKRLADAGVDVTYQCWEGQFHGSQLLAKLIPSEAAEYHRAIVDALRSAFRTNA